MDYATAPRVGSKAQPLETKKDKAKTEFAATRQDEKISKWGKRPTFVRRSISALDRVNCDMIDVEKPIRPLCRDSDQ